MKYACLMKCEGNKTYDKPGKCPVCGMKLVPVEEASSQGNDHHHDSHGHEHHDHT